MGIISIDIMCFEEGCKARFVTTVDRDNASYEARWICPDCGGGDVRRIPSAPNLMQRAYPDGVNKKNVDFKEALRLESESFNMDQKDRGLINKEIKRLKEIKR